MLPDFPAFKEELSALLNRFFGQRLVHHSGFVGRFGHRRAFEGNETTLHRATGDTESNNYERFLVSRNMPYASVPTMTLGEILKQLDSIAVEMAAQQAKFAFKRLDETLAAAGQTMSAGGKKITPEVLLQMLERIELDFDETGRMHLSIVTHPENAGTTEAGLRALVEDPVLCKKYEEVIERKKEAWRAREASRRLVG